MTTQEPPGASKKTSDEARLDEAIRKGDALLVSSLKREQRERARQKLIWGGIVAGGLIGIGLIFNAVLLVSSNAQRGGQAEKTPPKTADAHFDAAQQMARATEAEGLTRDGWRLWQSGQMNSAATVFEKAVQLDPQSQAAWNGLGWARFNSGDPTSGEKAFEKVLALNPDHPAALNGMGQIAVLRGEADKAEPYLLKAAPNAPAAWWGLTRVYLLKGNFPEAQKWAQKILDSGDKSIQPYLNAAKAGKVDEKLRRELTPLRS
jgi:tetratricopeptide (TPR) repeat protein